MVKKNLIGILFFLAIFVSGCDIGETDNIAPTPQTTTPNLPEVTSTAISHTATSSPIPTLLPEARQKRFYELMELNDVCRLPCLWGIEPLKTTTDEFINISEELRFEPFYYEREDELGSYTVGLDFYSLYNVFSFYLSNNHDTISWIKITGEGGLNRNGFIEAWKNYSPSRILQRYGPPSKIKLSTYNYTGEDPQPDKMRYDLYLYYDKKGIFIRYGGWVENKEIYTYCPSYSDQGNLAEYIVMYLKSPTNAISFENLIRKIDGVPIADPEFAISIEVATTLTINDFYSKSISGENFCFDAYKYIWP